MCNVTLRLCLDVNVFAADLRGRKRRLRPAACSDPVSHAVTGGFPGGETQLIISAADDRAVGKRPAKAFRLQAFPSLKNGLAVR